MIQTENPRFYINAAKALILELHISDTSGLEFVLEQPEARTSAEAISLWLISQSAPPYREDPKDWYARLKSKLKEILVSLKDSQYD
ncbi:MAG: hypothetical protein ACI9SP_004627 [Arenicella sp.]|jgi:hypothetical protein